MSDRNTVLSYALAALAGVCFVTGVILLTDEWSAAEHGLRKKTNFNN